MEDFYEEENNIYEENLNSKNLSDFYSENISKKDSLTQENNKSIEAILIKFDDMINSLDMIDDDFKLNQLNLSAYGDEISHSNLSDISSIEKQKKKEKKIKQKKDEFFQLNLSSKSLIIEIIFDLLLDKFNFFIKKFHTKHINKDKNSIIKCPLSNIDNNGECNCIPVITKSEFHIWFHCQNHKNIKYIELNTYLFLTNIDKIFIKGPRKINETNLSENIKFIQENSVKSKFKLGINKVNQNSGSFIVQIKAKLDEKIKDLNNFLMIYKDNKNFDETFKIQSMLNIKNTYFHFSEMLSILLLLKD